MWTGEPVRGGGEEGGRREGEEASEVEEDEEGFGLAPNPVISVFIDDNYIYFIRYMNQNVLIQVYSCAVLQNSSNIIIK